MPDETTASWPDQDGAGYEDSPAAASTLTVLLIDSDEPASDTTRRLLAGESGIRTIDGAHATKRGARGPAHRPDAVVLKVDARHSEADIAVQETVAKWHPAPVLVVTASEDRVRNRRMVRAGARGVVTRSREPEQLISAIHRVCDGEIWLARSCMSQLIDEMATASQPPAHLATGVGLERLTEREREVVALIALGMHNKAIAGELGITDHTVRHHLTAIFAKLGVADRLELAVYAFRHRDAGRR